MASVLKIELREWMARGKLERPFLSQNIFIPNFIKILYA